MRNCPICGGEVNLPRTKRYRKKKMSYWSQPRGKRKKEE
jgi:hypothetical protein